MVQKRTEELEAILLSSVGLSIGMYPNAYPNALPQNKKRFK
jgi:hypothetical protein